MTETQKEFLENLSAVHGNGTSLISYYIPGNYPIGKVNAFVKTEKSAWEHIAAKCKLYKAIPDTGIVLFSGSYV